MPENPAALRSTIDLRTGRTATHACSTTLFNGSSPGLASFARLPETEEMLEEVDLIDDELASKRELRRVA